MYLYSLTRHAVGVIDKPSNKALSKLSMTKEKKRTHERTGKVLQRNIMYLASCGR